MSNDVQVIHAQGELKEELQKHARDFMALIHKMQREGADINTIFSALANTFAIMLGNSAQEKHHIKIAMDAVYELSLSCYEEHRKRQERVTDV